MLSPGRPLVEVCVSAFARAVLNRCAQPAEDAVDDILLIGARLDLANKDVLCANDDRYLGLIIQEGTKQGIRFARNPYVRVCNLNYGADFLKSTLPTSLAAFCMIYYKPGVQTDRQMIDRSLYRQSDLCAKDGSWHEALMRTQARWAVNIHANDVELPTGFIARDPFRLVHTSRQGGRHLDFVCRTDVYGVPVLNGM